MMKYFYRIAIILSFIITKSEYYLKSKIFGGVKTQENLTQFLLDAGIRKISHPITIYLKFKEVFQWVADVWYLDYGKHPLVFLNDKYDDCDGFAFFYEYFLKLLGHEEVFRCFVMADNKKGHAVCIYKFDNQYFIVGNWYPITVGSSDLEIIGREVCVKMGGQLKYIAKFEGYKFITDIYK